ncbi:hypothetical protein K469DRAFT_721385 [Zopfia rhizophila CBS 207.26]|uniref:F-box domain-containing protein n=1 Tax=Zopfia rhizophila CBS 207.26 TaxID=1314779 RepID=A0A6A6EK70_9PEZI|nr:hypothetical protein K469DRAFT_721385 [Zopfia rhizophila CBS 207.26]
MPKRKSSDPERGYSSSKLHEVVRQSPSLQKSPGFSPFLELPAELRLSIYEYLVVANEPLQGRPAKENKAYCLSLAILRVNRQVYEEARSIFFGKNTFLITSVPEPNNGQTSPEGRGQFDPPLRRDRWQFIRHLTIDLLYYPTRPIREPRDDSSESWKPIDPGAAAYIANLISILESCGPKLQSLRLAAKVDESFCARKSLTSFFMCERDRAFNRALATVALSEMPFHFDFPDCFYHMEVNPKIFVTRSIFLLACQIMFCQSQVRIDRLLSAFENGRLVQNRAPKERTDLAPFVNQVWTGKARTDLDVL